MIRHLYGKIRAFPPAVQGLLVIIIIILTIAAFESMMFGVVWFSGVKDGLSIYVHATEDNYTVTQGTAIPLTYTVKMHSTPYCDAICTWQIHNHDTGEPLATGSMERGRHAEAIATAVYHAPKQGEYSVPVQLVVYCKTDATHRCQRPHDEAIMTSTTVIRSTYPKEKQTLARELETRLAEWEPRTLRTLAQLVHLTRINDTRTHDPVRAARQELLAFDDALRTTQIAINNETFALSLPNPEQHALETYQALRKDEENAVRAWDDLHESPLEAVSRVLPADEHAMLARSVQAVNAAVDTHHERPPIETWNAIRNTHALITDFAARSTAREDAQHLHDAYANLATARCTLLEQPCESLPARPTTLTEAVNALDVLCARQETLDARGEAERRAYAATRYPNNTLEEVEDLLTITEQNWEEREAAILAAASAGVRITTDEHEILAVRFTLTETATNILEAYCPPRTALTLSERSVRATLPTLRDAHVHTPLLRMPERHCCTLGGCTACATPQYPVLFLHGHSFSQHSTPEYNLQAFTLMAIALEQDGRLYAGNVFAAPDTVEGRYADIPAVSLTTTYYYDSFAEEGSIQYVPQKSERIETYAIRLHEIIENTKAQTGAPRVLIVAHSMGGLVTRQYAALFGSESLAGIVMIGTPNHGVTALTERLCPVVGADTECQEMRAGSLFLRKLNAVPTPGIPILTIAGVGCDDKDTDGVVDAHSVELDGAESIHVTGTCIGDALLHGEMLHPARYPEVTEHVRNFIAAHTTPIALNTTATGR